MPWPRVKPRSAVKARMFTFSWPHVGQTPAWRDFWRKKMFSAVVTHGGLFLNHSQIRAYYEVGSMSSDPSSPESKPGYQHCHLIVGWTRPVKFDGFHKVIKGWQSEVLSVQRSNACHCLPRGDPEAARLGAYACMLQYVEHPSKTKSIDGEGLTWIAPPPVIRPPRPAKADFFWELENILLPRLQEGHVEKHYRTLPCGFHKSHETWLTNHRIQALDDAQDWGQQS